ncbi:Glutamyl-tRNA amidotransferase B subunit [Dentipellis sp. KUC8613]|nr:Glutamyl-tRNA amidotransferase B subunit [Dentipellis sp. KUC8613]
MLARGLLHVPHHKRLGRLVHSLRTYEHDPRWPGWQVVIGLEVHAQIKSRAKLFSESWTSELGEPSNTHVTPYDAAFPGTLPHLNPTCVDLGLRTALALDANIQSRSSFDRKHYFYADLPAGYQITQRYAPLAKDGKLDLPQSNVSVRIEQIQLEQDTAKSTFDPRRRLSSIDLNRAGTGLMEIVSRPDMRSPEEAGEYVRTLQALLRSIGSSDGNMEQGSLRCDVNVSVNRPGEALGTRCEIKNLNSVRFMIVAIICEVRRHLVLLSEGKPVPQETRGFNENTGETFKLRSKEDAPDYRYMPDPNLPPLLLDQNYIEQIRQSMPELPHQIRARLQRQGLSQRDTDVLMAVDSGREVGYDGELGQGATAYFDALARGRDPKEVVNWITHDLLGQLAARKQTFNANPVSVDQMGNLIDLVQSGTITRTSGKMLLKYMLDHPSPERPDRLAQELSLMAMQDEPDFLGELCREVITKLPEEAEAVRQGNTKVLNKLVGSVMKSSRGRADAQAVRSKLREVLLPKGSS